MSSKSMRSIGVQVPIIKVFEEGLDKKDCELHNLEAWRLTFTTNVIQILVRDLVRKSKDLVRCVSNETKEVREQAHVAEQKIKFIESFWNVWLIDVPTDDDTYQWFMNIFDKDIPPGLEGIIPNLGAWILKCDWELKEIFDLKVCTVEATNKTLDAIKALEKAHVQETKLGEFCLFKVVLAYHKALLTRFLRLAPCPLLMPPLRFLLRVALCHEFAIFVGGEYFANILSDTNLLSTLTETSIARKLSEVILGSSPLTLSDGQFS
eukprot:Gb_11071 [translate_table: standard]